MSERPSMKNARKSGITWTVAGRLGSMVALSDVFSPLVKTFSVPPIPSHDTGLVLFDVAVLTRSNLHVSSEPPAS